MSAVMIPCTVAATLTADLTYNPSVHVQTVEIDRVGTDMIAMATNNFVKWYLRIGEFLNLTWNVRDISGAGFETDVSDTSANFNNIYAFARSGDVNSTESAPSWVDGGALYGHHGFLVTEASGAGVRFLTTAMTVNIPLTNDLPAYGASATDGSAGYVGATNVTYDRVLFDSDATGSIAGSSGDAHTATATTTTWGFDDASINLTVNWVAGQSSGENLYDAGQATWGRSEIFVTADAGATINVTKPYNDAAADFIQIGMDASNGSAGNTSTFAAGTTTLGNGSLAADGTTQVDDGLLDPLAAPTNMTSGSADDVSDSIDYASYFNDYTAIHNNSYGNSARRNLINVSISKPTVTVSQAGFTRSLQQAINQLTVTQDVSNTQSLRAAVRQAFVDGTIQGFQSGTAHNTDYTAHVGDVSLSLPFTVAGQERKHAAGSEVGTATTGATILQSESSSGAVDKTIHLTPIVQLVADTYYHAHTYTYHSSIA